MNESSVLMRLARMAVASRTPLVSALAATLLLRTETDAERRRELTELRRESLIWGTVGLVVAIIGLVILLSVLPSSGRS
jgi:hypothetical protein